MLALKEVVRDFKSNNNREKLNMQLATYIREIIEPFLSECKRLFAGTTNVLKQIKDKISNLNTNDMKAMKDEILEFIDE